MSIITTEGGTRADSLWSGDLPLLLNPTIDVESLPRTAWVPESQYKLAEWACIKKKFSSDPKRRYALIHAPAITAPVKKRICVRWQGFVANTNLRPTGNYTGKLQDAHRARQHLTLHGGDNDAAMLAQTRSLWLLHDMIHGYLDYPRDYTPPERTISLQHVVFTKVTPGKEQVNLLRPEDDPSGRAIEAQKKWIVTNKVFTGRRTDKGQIEPYPGVFFRRNDFVDVTATVDIVTIHSAAGNKLRIFLDMQSVILLRPASPIEQIYGVRPGYRTFKLIPSDDTSDDSDESKYSLKSTTDSSMSTKAR